MTAPGDSPVVLAAVHPNGSLAGSREQKSGTENSHPAALVAVRLSEQNSRKSGLDGLESEEDHKDGRTKRTTEETQRTEDSMAELDSQLVKMADEGESRNSATTEEDKMITAARGKPISKMAALDEVEEEKEMETGGRAQDGKTLEIDAVKELDDETKMAKIVGGGTGRQQNKMAEETARDLLKEKRKQLRFISGIWNMVKIFRCPFENIFLGSYSVGDQTCACHCVSL